jgi:hypothetical protein
LSLESELVAGIGVTIYNPGLDTSDLAAGHVLVDASRRLSTSRLLDRWCS